MNYLFSIPVGVALATLLMPVQSTVFTVRVENVSTTTTLQLSNGATAPAPTAPVLWLVHADSDPIFTDGDLDRGLGLEGLAEEGDPGRLAMSLRGQMGIANAGVVSVPVGATSSGPILPGSAYEFTFTASPGDRLTMAMMFGQSNDLFYAPAGRGIALFDGMAPRSGNITNELILWDAGTEVNQEPGLGPDQAPRQKGPNTGTAERAPVQRVRDRFTYPTVGQVIRVTITTSTTDHVR